MIYSLLTKDFSDIQVAYEGYLLANTKNFNKSVKRIKSQRKKKTNQS